MPFTKVPRSRRKSQPLMINATISLRTAVEKLAIKHDVSLAEIGRRALAQYISKSAEAEV